MSTTEKKERKPRPVDQRDGHWRKAKISGAHNQAFLSYAYKVKSQNPEIKDMDLIFTMWVEKMIEQEFGVEADSETVGV